MKKLWNVYRTSQVGGEQFGHYLCSVEAEDARTATGNASAGTMTSRLDLAAYPDEIDGRKSEWPDWAPRLISLDERKPGRPVEREGTYQRITLEVRSDLLKKIDASGKSRREYIEELLES